MQRRPDLVTILVLIFGVGVVFTGVSASQPPALEVPIVGQMQGISATQASGPVQRNFN
ncbi:MAG: hypothetical protein AB8B86_03520 [Pseudomonadales bacterium]